MRPWLLSRSLVRAASRRVPLRVRATWLTESEGELWHRLDAMRREGRSPLATRVDLFLRARGTFRHGWWVRRQEPSTRATSPVDRVRAVGTVFYVAVECPGMQLRNRYFPRI